MKKTVNCGVFEIKNVIKICKIEKNKRKKNPQMRKIKVVFCTKRNKKNVTFALSESKLLS